MSDEELDTGGEIEEPEPDEVEESPEAKPEEKPLILGKFKSQEDLERSYTELERKFHEERQPAPQQPGPMQDPEEVRRQINEAYWEDPYMSTVNTVQQVLAQREQADIARDELVEAFEDDPMFAQVGKTFKRELRKIDPRALLSPDADKVAEAVYNSVVGQVVRKGGGRAPAPTPRERVEAAARVGVGKPEAGADGGPVYSRREIGVLTNELGLSDDAVKRAKARAAKYTGEEE